MFDIFDHLISITENYRDKYGLMRKRSKYLRRAQRVLYLQRVFRPAPKLIIDKDDLPKSLLFDPFLDLKLKDFTQRICEVINENVYNDVKDLIRTEVQ